MVTGLSTLLLVMCKRCGGEGHHITDPVCPARTTPELADEVQTFCGSASQLSNLHKCPEGCVIADRDTTFKTSKHHYQFKKLKFHNKGAEAYELLIEEDSFKAMK